VVNFLQVFSPHQFEWGLFFDNLIEVSGQQAVVRSCWDFGRVARRRVISQFCESVNQ
jgi:hypothetical protein